MSANENIDKVDKQEQIMHEYEDFLSNSLPEPTIWENILEEAEEGRKTYQQLKDQQSTSHPIVPKTDSPMEYLDRAVFPALLPALQTTLTKARDWDVLRVQKSRFNGIDHIVELLWNRNPLHTERINRWIPLFYIPFVQQRLKKHPRPYYPLSWLWTQEQAALIIQSAVRAFLVRRRDDVQEMRQFWKTLKCEKNEEIKCQMAEEHRLNQAKEEVQQQEHENVSNILKMMLKEVVTSDNEEKKLMESEEPEYVKSHILNYDDMYHYKQQALKVEQEYNSLENII